MLAFETQLALGALASAARAIEPLLGRDRLLPRP